MEEVLKEIIRFFEEKELKDWKDSEKTESDKIKEIKIYLRDWLPKSAKSIGGMSMTTHPCTFVHPSSARNSIIEIEGKKNKKIEMQTSAIIAENEFNKDGYLRSGNVFNTRLDTYGNAALMRIYKFLQIKLADGLSILKHIESDTSIARNLLNIASECDVDDIRNGFLTIKKSDKDPCSSSKLKQIFFPTENDNYNQLSILMPSGIMDKLNNIIKDSKFSESVKATKDLRQKNEYSENIIKDYSDLTKIGFGGTKPQNISVINNENHGEYYFLPCFPPSLKSQKIKLPYNDFFKNCLYYKLYKTEFEKIHSLLKLDLNNISIRNARDNIFTYIVNDIIERILFIRNNDIGWSNHEKYGALPLKQKIYLDDYYSSFEREEPEAFKELVNRISKWILLGYKDICKSEILNDDTLRYLNKIVEEQAEVLL